jgi:hypothetical protein
LRELTANMPDTDFMLCYLDADEEKRRDMAITRADDPVEAARVFDEREADEAPTFDRFRQEMLDDMAGLEENLPHNIVASAMFTNDYFPSTLDSIVRDVLAMLAEGGSEGGRHGHQDP